MNPSMQYRVVVTLLLSSLILHPSSFAVKTERWELSSAQDFMRGKLSRIIVTSSGELKIGYGSTRLGEFAKSVWCSTVGADGAIYFGTGSPADVSAVGKDGKVTKLLETDAIAVTALAQDAQGNLYAATMADGKIFKIVPGKEKSGAEFCKLRSPYVWALAVDKQGNLFAATGPDGKIFRVTPDGKADEWYAAEDSNILCLAFDADGHLLAGGSDRGLLYRITEKGKATVVHEFAEDEVRSISVSGQKVYAALNKQKVKRPRAPGPRRPSAAEFEDLTQRLTAQYGTRPAAEPGGGDRETPPEARLGNLLAGTLYLVNANGRVDKLASWDNESIQNLATDADGGVVVAMAGRGRVYRVRAAQNWELLFDFDEAQALTLAVRDGRLAFVGTGNVGSCYAIDPQPANTGELTSEVHDGRFLTTWGNLSWRGHGAVSVATRSGNTALPDKTWSDWSAPLDKSPDKITSPRARFIQIRAQLTSGAEPVLNQLDLYYQIQNQKPELTSVEIGEKPKPAEKPKPEPAGEKTDAADSVSSHTQESQRPKPASTVKKLTWRASDKDGDALDYRLYYRSDGGELWIPLPLDKPLKKTEHSWDTESIPDGWYRIKVVASDEDSNPAGEALTDEKISDLFKVDNRPPEVAQLAFDAETGKLNGVAKDSLSLIKYLEYSVDGGEWKFFAPSDGVFDDRTEAFAVTLPKLPAGPHDLAVRAIDEEGNIGVEKLSVKVK